MINEKLANDGWTLVKSKKRVNKHSVPQIKLNSYDVVKKLGFMNKYAPRGVYLFGSTARGTNTEYSDLDIMIIWNRKISENINEIKLEISSIFNKRVDLISMIYVGSLMLSNDATNILDATSLFLHNVISEAITVIGDIHDIELSEFIMKN